MSRARSLVSKGVASRSTSVPVDSHAEILSRATLVSRLDAVLGDVRGRHCRVAVYKLDIDNFKDVNAAYGRGVGDVALAEVVRRLARLTSEGWCVGGAGGDRFVAFIVAQVPDAEQDAWTRRCAARLSSVFDDDIVVGSHRIRLGGSVGIAHAILGQEGACVSADGLLHDAEVAMYRAKRVHGGPALFDPDTDAFALERARRIRQLSDAIDNNQLVVHYQPVVDMRSRAPVSFEALVRWQHPDRGMVPPSEFIPLAEECGLNPRITRFVISQVLADAPAFTAHGERLRCAVNLSPLCLSNEETFPGLAEVLRHAAGTITAEVTESALVDDRAVTALRTLNEHGVTCAVDDFGTGYSSLALLKTAWFSRVKIDRSFVKDIVTDDRDFHTVKAVVALAHGLGMTVIAEGMEAEATAERLIEAGVVFGQGYLYSRPMPIGELRAWLVAAPPPDITAGRASLPGGGPLTPALSTELLTRLTAADRLGVADLYVSTCESGTSLSDLVDHALAPAMREVGELWQGGVWTVADEHLATGAVDTALTAAALARRRAATRGKVVVACVEGDWHSLPARMIAEVAGADGWSARFLGASQPTADLLDYVRRNDPDAILLGCAVPMALPALVEAVTALAPGRAPVYVGGRALGSGPRRAMAVGADGWAANSAEVLRLLLNPTPKTAPHPDAPDRLRAHELRRSLIDPWARTAMPVLAVLMPAVASYPERIRDRTRADLEHLLLMASIAVLLDDDTLMIEQATWLASLFAARALPADAMKHGLAALCRAAPHDPHAEDVVHCLTSAAAALAPDSEHAGST